MNQYNTHESVKPGLSNNYYLLLNSIEFSLERDDLSEFVFGINHNYSQIFDQALVKVIAFKKMLHSLETLRYKLDGLKGFENYDDKLNSLKLKLEDRLKIELLKNVTISGSYEIETQNAKSNAIGHEVNDKTPQADLPNYTPLIHLNKTNEHIKYCEPNKIDSNEDLKNELVELANEMKYSAFRFQKLLNLEKKVRLQVLFQIILILYRFYSK
ncbi:hypothetical protein HWI79_1529 [Cryptosporidium felis]|nr:hypothetical protein HWI79_1529 [Cryptosporidium felis]